MQVNVHLTRVSNNKKVGPIPVSTTSINTCPPTCPLMNNGCYANQGPLNIHWKKVSSGERGMSWDDFCDEVSRFKGGTLWRHNQAGDLPHTDGEINLPSLQQLVKANRRHKGFTYTHHDMSSEHNLKAVREANTKGFTVNVSGNHVRQAVEYFKQGLPTVTVLPIESPNVQMVDDVKVVACPAEKSSKVTCSSCGLCVIPDRDYIIGFRAHGTKKKAANIIAKG